MASLFLCLFLFIVKWSYGNSILKGVCCFGEGRICKISFKKLSSDETRGGRKEEFIIHIEIQVARTIYMPQRSLYYWSKIYCEQLEISEKYSKLKKTICINILDSDTLQTTKYHSTFKIKKDDEIIALKTGLDISEIKALRLENSHH